MLLTCLVSLLTAAQPDAGLSPVARTHSVKWLPTSPGQSVRARLDVETFWVGGERAGELSIEVLTVSLPDGGTTAGLDQVNAALHKEYRDDSNEPIPGTAALQDGTAPLYAALASQYASDQFGGIKGITVTVPFLQGPFLQVHSCTEVVGAYASINCGDLLLRVDTGAPWTWLDGVAAALQAAFLEACTLALTPASKAARADYVKNIPERDRDPEFLEKNYPERCDARHLRSATVQPDGDLRVDMGAPTHANPWAAWAFTLPRTLLAKWADPKGPLAHLATKR